jgi:N-glycosylase/DNA lyase
MTLINELKRLKKSEIGRRIDARLEEFARLNKKGEKEWFSELCFCLLTANSKARTAFNIQNELGFDGFYSLPAKRICQTIIKHKHRFHNTKTARIVEGRKHFGIKATLLIIIKEEGIIAARQWLQENVKGYGYKEASHFLRNVGFDGVAILDRHIINVMLENGYLRERPKNLSRKNYLEIEQIFKDMAKKAGMSMAELDMYMWYMKAKDVLK